MQHISDADGLNFLRQQTRVLSARAFNVEYDTVNIGEYVPVNTDYAEWAAGVDFQIGDVSGAAKWQSGWAKDVPLADVKLTSVGSDFAMYAVGYRYNVEEVGKALHAGYPLTARKAAAARQAADYFVAETAFYGGGHPGWTGLINLAGVNAAASPATGTGTARNWFSVAAGNILTGLKTPDQIISELNSIVTGPLLNTLGFRTTQLSDTILIPSLVLKYLTDTPYGVTAPNKSLLQYFRENNPYTSQTGQQLTIRDLPALAGAADATSGTNLAGQGRIVGYRNNLDALELPLPMAFNFRDVHQEGPLQWEIPGIGRVGQLIQTRNGSIRYLDGVSPVPA